jgi:hypothetical protein
MFTKDIATLNSDQTQDLIGHLVAAIASGHVVTVSVSDCSEGCHTSIMVNGERAARVNL